MKKKKLNSFEFIQQLKNAHLYRIAEEIEILETIDKIVDFMGDELPEAHDIIDKIQWRIRNDENF